MKRSCQDVGVCQGNRPGCDCEGAAPLRPFCDPLAPANDSGLQDFEFIGMDLASQPDIGQPIYFLPRTSPPFAPGVIQGKDELQGFFHADRASNKGKAFMYVVCAYVAAFTCAGVVLFFHSRGWM